MLTLNNISSQSGRRGAELGFLNKVGWRTRWVTNKTGGERDGDRKAELELAKSNLHFFFRRVVGREHHTLISKEANQWRAPYGFHGAPKVF